MATHEPLSVGVFDDLEKAQRTLDELRRHGFQSNEIGIIGHVGEEQQPVSTPTDMKAPERNVMRGACAGAIFGALIGILTLLIIPGLGEVSGQGRWFEIVGGAILGAAVGAVFLALGGLFFSQPEGRFYERELEKGRFLVTVKNPDRHQEALIVLRREAVPVASETE